jgi:mannose/cellobiose epimerase-like protein (N-acyl-D-glucosamine 2-epimerase family)
VVISLSLTASPQRSAFRALLRSPQDEYLTTPDRGPQWQNGAMAQRPDSRFSVDDPAHATWLAEQTDRLFAFYESRVIDPAGGFFTLDDDGAPLAAPKELYATARMTYCFALGHRQGRPGHAEIVEHGLTALRGQFADTEYGGWFSRPDQPEGPKQTYAHAFVLLAAATALQAGFDSGDVLARVNTVFAEHLYDPIAGLNLESWDRRWTKTEDYRGLNANMHSLEAFMAGYESVDDDDMALRASSIAQRTVSFAENARWRVPEHFNSDWRPQPDYNADNRADQFRPYGTTPGHGFEWARLLVQLWALDGAAGADWLLDAAQRLFARAVEDGWDRDAGGIYYTVDERARPVIAQRLHWPITEAIGAAYYLYRVTDQPEYAGWYTDFWAYADEHFIDHERGGWYHERAADGSPSHTIWAGKPDLYHALGATLILSAQPQLPRLG